MADRTLISEVQASLHAGTDALARFDRRKHRPLSVTPEFYDLDYEELTLSTDDGVALAAWFVPGQPGLGPAGLMALLHHHFGGQKAALLPWIELFSRLGVACLAFDARGHAGSPCEPRRETYRQRFFDVRAARAELLRRGARRLLLYAQSQGGSVVIGGLAGAPEVAGLITDSGPAASAVLSVWGLARSLPAESTPQPTVAAGSVCLELLRRIRPATYALHFYRGLVRLRRCPLLWLHGSEDVIIPRPWAQAWFDGVRPVAGPWQSMLVPGAAHAECLQVGGEAVEHRVARFVAQLAPQS